MTKLKIKSIRFEERDSNNSMYWKSDNFHFDNMNLIIGPNASGKTQFIRRIAFLKELHRPSAVTRNLNTVFKCETLFEINQDGQADSKPTLSYKLTVKPGPIVSEEISIVNGEVLFRTEGNQAFLLDETNNAEKSFLLNNSMSITKQVRGFGANFKTIIAIGDFFQSILLLQADKLKTNNIMFSKSALVPSEEMDNISSVVLNWQIKHPQLYKELYNKFILFFDTISGFERKTVPGLQDEVLAMTEKGVKQEVEIYNLSAGMVRILSILALPLVRLIKDSPEFGKSFVSSLILIDEIDNGLDYEKIGTIIDHLKAESDFYQIIVSSHSPVVCNFIDPEFWRIFRRKEVNVRITSPLDIEETRKFIEQSKKSNWELYRNHISKSPLYSVN